MTAKYDTESNSFQIITHRSFKRGEECFISYGPHDNAFLLAEYGFILSRPPSHAPDTSLPHLSSSSSLSEASSDPPVNTYDCVLLDEDVSEALTTTFPPPLDLRERVVTELQTAAGLSYSGNYSLRYNEEPSFALMNALRLYACAIQANPRTNTFNNQLVRWRRVLHGADVCVSVENETLVKQMLIHIKERARRRCEDAIARVECFGTGVSAQMVRALNVTQVSILLSGLNL